MYTIIGVLDDLYQYSPYPGRIFITNLYHFMLSLFVDNVYADVKFQNDT